MRDNRQVQGRSQSSLCVTIAPKPNETIHFPLPLTYERFDWLLFYALRIVPNEAEANSRQKSWIFIDVVHCDSYSRSVMTASGTSTSASRAAVRKDEPNG